MVCFGNKLKELRSGAGLTQQQLADALWVTKATISYYEQSTRTPSPEMLVKIAKYFRVTTDYLLGIEEKRRYIDISGLDDEDIEVVQAVIDRITELRSPEKQKKRTKDQKDFDL